MDVQAESGVPSAVREALARNLAAVRARMSAALARAGRPQGACRLVAVTKTVAPAVAVALAALGVEEIGENRVQDLVKKRAALAASGLAPRLHMIGHLQRNKVKQVIEAGAYLHALDSERLALAIEAAHPAGRPLPALVEVNVSGEASKGGLPPEELEPFLARRHAAGRIAPAGLMTMAPLADAGDRARPHVARLRALRDALAPRFPGLSELSMGMTQDFEAGIAEGATFVRIGRALFEGIALPGEAG
jgi:hypothetical protein